MDTSGLKSLGSKDQAKLTLSAPDPSARAFATVPQFVRFAVVGAGTVAVDFALLYGLTGILGVNYLLSAAVAFFVASTCNYLLSVRYVFQSGRFDKHVEFGFFMSTSLVGLGINQIVLYLLVAFMGTNYLVAKFVSIGVVSGWNFVSKKKLVFRW